MLIEPESCPPAVQQVALQKLQGLLDWAALGLQPAGLRLSLPHRVCNLGARGLLGDMALHQAVDPAGWRFLIVDATAPTAAVRAAVQTWQEDGHWKVSSVRTGTWATATEAALRADGLPQPATLAYLWCRITWTAALWLRTADQDGDRVIPLPYVAGLVPLAPVTPAEYLGVMRSRSRGRPSANAAQVPAAAQAPSGAPPG
jgi:hypothetical protein